jgi:hypothetical protein
MEQNAQGTEVHGDQRRGRHVNTLLEARPASSQSVPVDREGIVILSSTWRRMAGYGPAADPRPGSCSLSEFFHET